MEEKTAKELVKQLTRIADALEKSNTMQATVEKRRALIDKLEEKNLKADLREKVKIDPEKPIATGPRIGSEG